jgi:hypothetical protein
MTGDEAVWLLIEEYGNRPARNQTRNIQLMNFVRAPLGDDGGY